MVSVAFKVLPDHLLEVLGKIADVVVKAWVGVASKVVVKLWNCSLEQIGGLELCDDLCDLTAALGAARYRALTRLG